MLTLSHLWGHRANALPIIYPVLFEEIIATSHTEVCVGAISSCVDFPESSRALVGVFETIPVVPTIAEWIRKNAIESIRMAAVLDA
jgi:hypothetical protein